MKTAVIFQGEPSSGKDFYGKHLLKEDGGTHLEFKEQLYIDTAEYFYMKPEAFKALAKGFL